MTFKIGHDWQDAKLVMTQDVIPGSNVGSRGAAWLAAANWNGETYTAESRNGAPYALARELVAAGCPDQPVCVITRGHKTGYRSLLWMASRTLEEGKRGLILVRYQERPQDLRERGAGGGESSPPVVR